MELTAPAQNIRIITANKMDFLITIIQAQGSTTRIFLLFKYTKSQNKGQKHPLFSPI